MSEEPYLDHYKRAVENLSTPLGADHEHTMIARAQVWATLTLAEAIRQGTAALKR